MVSYVRTSDLPYSMTLGLEDVNLICNQEKTVPLEWISKDGSDVTDAFLAYALPLIQGTVEIPLGTDGLPDFLSRNSNRLGGFLCFVFQILPIMTM